MRYLVTGGAGFIGSHLVDALLDRGDDVVALDDLSQGRESNLAGAMKRGGALVVADVVDQEAVGAAFDEYDPELVFHLAAQADVRRSVADPTFDASVNVLGTINVLEAARRSGRARVVFAATGGAVYGEGEGRELPFRESVAAEPLTPYGASKLAGEAYVSIYSRLHGVAGVALRFGNVFGPRQDPHGEAGVVAIFCGLLLAGASPTIFGDGMQTRDYIYVDDTVAALVAAGDALASQPESVAGPYNVGTGAETTVLELFERLREISGAKVEASLAPARPGEVQRVSIDPTAAGADLGWAPRVALEQGLRTSYAALSDDRI